MKKKKDKKKVIFEIYIDGEFIYAAAPQPITGREYMAIIGVYKTMIETLEKEQHKWIN